uniref:Uncharacterized protein n=1 Tax=Strigamia maritima TaxID=126957 RepID=T1IIY5_STRMM
MNAQFLLFWTITILITTVTAKRKARSLIGLTNGGRINIGVQFILPLTVSLPMVSGNVGRKRRSIEGPLEDDEQYDLDPWHGPRLRKLDFYFEQLNIDDEACRERLMCEIAAEPDTYYPLSQLLLTKFEDDIQTPLQRMRGYETAVLSGGNETNTCAVLYSSCPETPSQLLNLPMIRLWQTIDQFFQINMYEEMDL